VAEFYLRLVKLEQFVHANIHELSGGMKQRVVLARSLAPNPRVLLMDEPFAALDALTREQLYGDLQDIWQKRRKTILFVTHNVREAACLGNRVILFSPRPGRIREEFRIDLPRPRDINSVELAQYSMEIMKALRRYLGTDSGVRSHETETPGPRVLRRAPPALAGPRLVPRVARVGSSPPIDVGRYLVEQAASGTLPKAAS